MDVRIEVRRLVRDYLSERNEDAAWMRGPWNQERQAAYERILGYVCRTMNRRMGWRVFLERRESIVVAVRELIL